MALLKGVLLSLCCFLSTSAQDAVTVNCGDDMITVGVELNFFGLPLDPNRLSLGSCPVSSVQESNRIAFFSYGKLDCRFMRMITSNISYMNNMVYEPTQRDGFYQTPFVAPVLCIYNKPSAWLPPVFSPALGDAAGMGKLEFSMKIMNDDFSAPRVSNLFFLGSPIQISASVNPQSHMPLILYMEECLAASTAELSASSQTYPLITNHGCFVDGRTANSRFLPRIQTSEIRVSIQAFKFTQDDSAVFIHCQILAWDPAQLQDPTKKACSFNMQTKNWELLDNPDQSTSVCGCCNSVCTARRRRDTDDGLRRTAVLGPLRIASREQSTNCDDPLDQDEDLSLALLLIVATLLVMAVLGALSLGYYFCVWKSGRAGPKTNYDLLVSPQKS
ncbi:zona pellucida sperm-binding protein 3-like [Acipenser ruthenus]|uniref:zona pellucida sperm-binding protein 3-like n=1 Tax=Acipenser ruthenus TaxID=7906 RepID=UPI00274066B8|nr:zona pellucida sperm-binding protein 3-like [Acipenser ruthenus]